MKLHINSRRPHFGLAQAGLAVPARARHNRARPEGKRHLSLSGMRRRMHSFARFCAASGLLLVALVVGAQAEVSQETETVRGRAPAANAVVITNQSAPGADEARVGHVLIAGYGFADADGDTESGSIVQWLRDGVAISGATSNSYTVSPADAGSSLSVQVMPQTDPSMTDPAAGMLVTSAEVAVKESLIDNFLTPDTVPRLFVNARSYCQNQGARLPTVDELQQLFVDATSSPTFNPNPGFVVNYEMCTIHGWPLNNQCGGTQDQYWTSEKVGTAIRYVNMLSGGAGLHDSAKFHVACVRL